MKRNILTLLGIAVLFVVTQVFAATVTPKGKKLNLRKNPTVKSAKVGTPLTKGMKLEVLKKKARWIQVKTEDGRVGWVSANLTREHSAKKALKKARKKAKKAEKIGKEKMKKMEAMPSDMDEESPSEQMDDFDSKEDDLEPAYDSDLDPDQE